MRSRFEELAPVFRALRSSVRAWVAALTLLTAAVTAVVYALPFDQATNDTASNLSFMVMMVFALLGVGIAIGSTDGAQRNAWIVIFVSFAATAALFGLDPQTPDGDLTIALDVAVLPSLAFALAVLALCLPVLPRSASLRTLTDIGWLGIALLVVSWSTVVDPVIGIVGRSDAERLAHLGFVGTTLVLTLSVLVIIPNVRGAGRVVLWCLGLGGGLVSMAGVLHIQFFYDGSLRFGSAFDYLWTAGIGFLTFGALLAGDHHLEFRQRGMAWNSAITIVPLIPAVIALTRLDHEAENPFGVVLIIALGVRVLALLFENDRLTRGLIADAANDPLTGLANRRTLLQGIGGVGATAARRGRYRAVLSIDLDRFKAVNDQYGHLVGDRVLALVAERLRQGVRGDAALIRFGGDEFLVAIDIPSPDQAARAGERIRQAVAGAYVIDELIIAVDATIGIGLDDGRQPVNAMLELADQALYTAKDLGRGRVHVLESAPVRA